MSKRMVLRCIRPQCMNIYEKNSGKIWCDCGAKLEEAEVDISDYKKPKRDDNAQNKEHKSSEKKAAPDKKINHETGKRDAKAESRSNELQSASRQSRKASIYLLLDGDDEEKHELKTRIVIGRNTEENKVDVDLSKYDSEKKISRRHAAIEWRQDGYYITKISTSHSLHVNEKALDVNETVKLKNEDMIVLSRAIAFQFEEEE